jgi:hypothetical protein
MGRSQTVIVRDAEKHEGMIEVLKRKLRFPYVMKITDGEPRSLAQNRLVHKWYGELADQDPQPDHDGIYYEAYCKLHFGVGIMKEDDPEYAAFYDQFVKPRPYEEKIEMMKPPYGFPVTSEMTMKQMTRYMDIINMNAAKNGLILTQPDESN